MTKVIAACAGASWALFTLLWFRQRATKNATAVDAFWVFGIGAVTAAFGCFSTGNFARRAVVTVLVNLWAFRLGGHLLLDRVMKGVEDSRYAHFRREWSQCFWYVFYMGQAALVVLLPLTFLGVFRSARIFPTGLDAAGLVLWAVSVMGESLADRQLARFRADPANKGKTCQTGLWRYSRHPNYFFEWLI